VDILLYIGGGIGHLVLNGVILAVSILGKDRISSKLMFTPT
jgi:hypothetical protein